VVFFALTLVNAYHESRTKQNTFVEHCRIIIERTQSPATLYSNYTGLLELNMFNRYGRNCL